MNQNYKQRGYYTISLASQFLYVLDLNEKKILTKIKEGEIKAEKIQGKWFIYHLDLRKFLNKSKI